MVLVFVVRLDAESVQAPQKSIMMIILRYTNAICVDERKKKIKEKKLVVHISLAIRPPAKPESFILLLPNFISEQITCMK